VDQRKPTSRESRLLLACARLTTTEEDKATIRQILGEGIDWTIFAGMVVDRGVASLAAHKLVCVARGLVPPDILDAFCEIVHQTRIGNGEILAEIRRNLEEIPCQGPRLATENALAAASGALTNNPADVAAWRNLGRTLSDLHRYREAIACYDRATALAPDYAANWIDRARAMSAAGRRAASLPYIERALSLDPEDAQAWTRYAYVLSDLQRYAEASEASDRALALDPDNIAAARIGIHALLFVCDWQRRETIKRRIDNGLKAGRLIITPFINLAMSESEAENLALARLWAKTVPPSAKPLWRGERYRHDKIRIAYISTDFRDTLSVNAIAGCFEGHDKTRFEITGISLNPDDGSDTRRRIVSAFDHFVEAQAMSDAQVATLLRDCEIDIAIDLNGYAGDKRTEIVAARPAPLQVNYAGYAGTTAMPFIDYIIADRIVIPEEHHVYYSEKVVYLPHTFFPTDRKRRIAEYTPTRTEAGLPETGFIFACHNTAYKITPEVFEIWMRLLRAVEGSVLWLSSTIDAAVVNLRREAAARRVAPERLVFGPRVPKREDHLGRLRLADLFLDTLPYNAHTTACDALWVGLPVLTCAGATYAGRVAASLLYAVGLPELVTASLVEYEELALVLARAPKGLAAIKEKLKRNRDTEPLFDTRRFTRDLERAYTIMWERQQRGLSATSFAVDCAPAGLAYMAAGSPEFGAGISDLTGLQ
jgi:protein O-GlcNAc transferase